MNVADLYDGFLVPRERYGGKEALNFVDSALFTRGSMYGELHWTVADALRWIAERTRAAVDGISIGEEDACRALAELDEALELGEIRLIAIVPPETIPRELSPETWSAYALCFKPFGELLRPCVVHDATNEERLREVRLRRRDVLERWPSAELPAAAANLSTAAKETACKGWLTVLMKGARNQPRGKEEVWAEALAKLPGLSRRAFDRSWTVAIRDAGALAWRTPGRRKIQSPH